MKRVMIIGGPGSGKSVLATRLHAVTGLPLYHLDRLYWQPGWQAPPQDEWHRTVARIAAQDEWIMDGGYRNSFHLRMPRADTILWLDLPRRIAFSRVLKRMAFYFGRVREDAAQGCPERFDWAFLKWAWTFRREHASKYHLALASYVSHATLMIFTSPRAVSCFLASLSR